MPDPKLGGRYRLCWCAENFACISPSDHRTDVGSFSVIGPQRLGQIGQHRTCVSGQTCIVSGLLLESPSDLNSIIVLSTCGYSDAVIEGWPLGAVATDITASGTSAYWSETIKAQGGRYRLCWCSGACNSVERFSADLGSMFLVGPAPLQYARTCISGRACSFDGLVGEGLQVGDSIQLLNTCGTHSAVAGAPLTGRTVTLQGGSVSWGSLPITAPGGRYKLCWCSANFKCGQEEFRLELGTLDVLGPRPLSQDRTCISGLTCLSPQLTGYHIGSNSRVALLSSCGGSDSVKDEIGSAQWSRGIVSAPGGSYRICWCMPDEFDPNSYTWSGNESKRNMTDCSLYADFQTDVGSLKVLGPAPWDQRQTCISGQTCRIAIQGEAYLPTARVLILETCGLGATFPGGHFMPRRQVEQGSSDLGMHNAEEIKLASGGTYRLCWCAGTTLDVQNVTQGCLESSQFQTDFGSVDIVGPAPLEQHRTCVSGLSCEIQGIQGLYLNQDRLPDISGIRIKQDGSVIFDVTRAVVQVSYHAAMGPFVDVHAFELQTGTSDWQEVSFNETNAPFFRFLVQETSSGWQPKLREIQWYSRDTWVQDLPATWLHGASGIPFKTLSSTPYVHGPEQLVDGNVNLLFSRWEPTGFPRWYGIWHVTFDFRDGDKTLILDTCGSAGVAHVTQKLPEAGMVEVVSQSGATVAWNTPLSAAGGEYKLCWCGAYQDCDTSDQFRTSIGTLTLIGPRTDHARTCVSGQICKLEGLQGHFLSDESMIAILDTCAQVGLLTEQARPNSVNVPFTMLSTRGSMADFGRIATSSDGLYRLCWCPMVEGLSNLTVVVNGSDINRTSLVDCFKVDMGELHLVGPVSSEGRTCISGRACFLDGFRGQYLLDTDRAFVMDTCGHQVARGFDSQGAGLVQSIGTVQWASQPITATGGRYRLCWCSLINSSAVSTNVSGNPIPCEAAHVDGFLTDVGTLHILGPNPFSQSWTCVAGESCKISGIQGFGLSDSDSIMVLQTCSTAALVPRFPMFGQAETVFNKGSEAAWITEVSAAGGTYQLCWCSEQELDGNITGCTAPEHAVSFGTLTILGPSPLWQLATCISGQSCRVDGMTGLDWTQATDFIAVMNTCGVTSAIPRWGNEGIAEIFLGVDSGASFAWQYAAISAAGGNYRLCWCGTSANHSLEQEALQIVNSFNSSSKVLHASNTTPTSSRCERLSDFKVDFGRLSLLGPDLTSFTCVAGQSCRIDSIYGSSSLFYYNYVVLDTCGFVKGFVDFLTVNSSETDGSVSFGVGAVGGEYRLCWCPTSRNLSECQRAEDFRVDVAEITVIGPNPHSQDHTCISGNTCVIKGITGWHLSSDMAVMVLESCGQKILVDVSGEPRAALTLSGPGIFRMSDMSKSVNSSGWELTALKAPAGQYRLCWCYGMCEDLSAFSLQFGTLSVISPAHGKHTCFAGLLCAVDLDMDLDSGGIFLADTCGSVATKQFLQLGNVSTVSEGVPLGGVSLVATITTLSGGSYRLCWCASCDESVPFENFRIDLGELQLLGPNLHQHHTCILGLSCSIPPVSDLSESHVMLLDTCGFSGVSALQWNVSSGTRVFVETTSVPAREYRLCWCGASCISEDRFIVDFGRLSVLGPNPLQQQVTCISGHPCSFHELSFHGVDIETHATSIMLLDTCASSVGVSAIWQKVHFGNVNSEGIVQGMQGMQAHTLTSGGGSYRLCWCVDTRFSNNTCLLPQQFSLEIGQLTLLGPRTDQHITCIAGASCSLSDFQETQGLAETSVLVLDTCTFSTPQVPLFVAKVGIGGGIGATRVGVFPGLYRLCWFNCDVDVDVALGGSRTPVDAGTLTLVGPRHNQQWTCISGMTCVVNEIKGHLLSISDHYLVMDTCGIRAALHFPQEGSIFAVNGQCGCASQICTATLGEINGTSCDCGNLCPVNMNKLHPGQCGCSIEDVDSDADGIADCLDGCPTDIYKSSPGICGCGVRDLDSDGDGVPDCVDQCPGLPDVVSGTCCSAVDSDSDGIQDCFDQCPYDVSKVYPGPCGCGVTDVDSDLDSVPDCLDLCPTDSSKTAPGICGCGSPEDDMDRDGVPDCIDVCPGAGDADFHGISASFGQVPISAASGMYRLCWCQAADDCASTDFHMDVGSLQVLGILDIQSQRTCVSGQSCYIQRLLNSFGVPNRSTPILVLDTCGEFVSNGSLMGFDSFERFDPQISAEQGGATGWQAASFPLIGGYYRLCWCSNKRCSNVPDFRIDVGELMLIGPFPTEQTCIAGQTCHVTSIKGLGVRESDHIRILESCGVRGAQTPQAQAQNTSNLPAVSNVPGGSYRLCWCASGFTCLLNEDFRVDVGEFSYIGPALFQDRTCITGQVCQVDQVIGHMLDSGQNSFWILDTCGILETTPRMAGYGKATQTFQTSNATQTYSASSTRYISWDIPHTAFGGQYRLCWCSGSQCEVSGNHQVDVGQLLLIGPIPQDRTCVSGRPCHIKAIPGFYLEVGDQMLVLDTCGTTSHVSRFPPLTVHLSTNVSSVQGVVQEVQGFVSGAHLELESVTSSGGQYSLCWCSAQAFCRLAQDFRVFAGSLTLLGPEHNNLLCIAGQLCVAFVADSNSDGVMLLETCGTLSTRRAWKGTIFSSNATTGSVGLPGGLYRLCWCGSQRSSTAPPCRSVEDFRVDAGQVELVGPSNPGFQRGRCERSTTSKTSRILRTSYEASRSDCWLSCIAHVDETNVSCQVAEFDPKTGLCFGWSSCQILLSDTDETYVRNLHSFGAENEHHCMSGQSCIINVPGHLLTKGDGYAVLETCGISSESIRAVNIDGHGFGVPHPCGCSAALNDTDGDGLIDCKDECPQNADKIQVGLCGCSQTDIDSDSDGTPDCMDRCPFDPTKRSPGVCGCGIPDVDSDLDGVPDCNDRCPGFADASGVGVVSVGCFAADSDGDGVLDFADECPLDQNKTSIGTCGCGESEADDDQDGVPNCVDLCPSNPHKVFPGACGCSEADIDRDGDGTPDCYDHCQSMDSVFQEVTVNFGLVPTGQYRLCWCSRSLQKCALDTEFNVDFSGLRVLGPNKHEQTCISGQPCEFGLVGIGLQSEDRLLILDDCGHNPMHLDILHQPLLETLAVGAFYGNGITLPGGQYRICWCSMRQWQGIQLSCDVATDFVDAGKLLMIGPSLQRHTCVSGQPCSPDFTGVTAQDTIRILNTCGRGGTDLAVGGSNVSRISQNVSALSLSGGSYRLCWCYGECLSTQVDFGSLEMLGPIHSTATCVSGQTCEFALQIYHASLGDSLLLLDTCGLGDNGITDSTRGHCGKTEIGSVPISDFLILADLTADNMLHCRTLCEEVAENTGGNTGNETRCVAAMYKDVDLNVSENPIGHCRLYAICSAVSDASSEYMVLFTPSMRQQNLALPGLTSKGFISGIHNITTSQNGLSKEKETETFETFDTAVFSWFNLFLTSAGSIYRMCWCADGFRCETPSDFSVDVGPLVLIGPIPESRTCVSGLRCVIEVAGLHLSFEDEIFVQDTCGADFNGPFGHVTAVTDASNNSGLATFVLNKGNPLVVQGGQYRLCWCAGTFSCVLQPHSADIGELLLIGPFPLQQQRTCVTGQHCVIEGLEGGRRREVLDLVTSEFAIMDTCVADAPIPHLPNEGILQALPACAARQSWTFGAPIAISGGIYRLCWCPVAESSISVSPCRSGVADFIDAGSFHLLGPQNTAYTSVYTCISGQHCDIAISGDISGNLQILDTCGIASFIPGLSSLASESSESSGKFSMGSDIDIISAAGSFRFCWCASGFDCSASDRFRVDVGQLFILGPPSVSMQRTCVSGMRCSWSIPLRPGDLNQLDRDGFHQFTILQTCGVAKSSQSGLPLTSHTLGQNTANSTADGLPSVHFGELTARGSFRLCWCGEIERIESESLVQSSRQSCSSLEAFRVDVGTLTLVGPLGPFQRTCVSGYSCALDGLEGGSLGSFGDHMTVLNTCGEPGEVSGILFAHFASNASNQLRSLVSEPTTLRGGGYRLCWCSSLNRCSTDSDFNVDVGSLTMIGPSPLLQSWTCISGSVCQTSFITGQDLSSNDSIVVLDDCASGTYTTGLASETGSMKVAFVSSSILALQVEQITAAAGTYRLCWCQPLNPQMSECELATQHRVDFGSVTLLGPGQHGSVERTCIAGQQCTIEGLSLPIPSSVLVLDTCSAGWSVAKGWPAVATLVETTSGSSTVRFGRVTASGGVYELCWCGADVGSDCLKFGEIALVGPSPFQHRICYSGQLCNLRNFKGFGIETLKMTDISTFFFMQDGTSGDFDVKDYTLQVSHDLVVDDPTSATWVTVASCIAEKSGWQNCSFREVSAPFWRWQITSTWGSGPPKPREVQFNGVMIYQSSTGWTSDPSPSWVLEETDLSTGVPHRDVSDPSNPISYFAQNLMDGSWIDASRWWPTGFGPWSVIFDFREVDHLLLLDTCAASVSVVDVVDVVRGNATLDADADGLLTVVSSGGSYRLCWCSRGKTCEKPEDFAVDLGALTVIGPNPLRQSRTCVVGQSCQIDRIDIHVGSELADLEIGSESWASGEFFSFLYVLETCGSSPWWGSFSQNSSMKPTLEGHLIAGEFRLCWCSSICNYPEEMIVDVGEFLAVGASTQQDRTCVSGQTCLLGISGYDLSEADRFLIVRSCGEAHGTLSTSITVSNLVRSSGSVNFDASVSSLTVSTEVLLASGDFRLCWCSSQFQCVDASEFRVDVGSLSIIGPSDMHHWSTCVSGQGCVLEQIRGKHLSPQDRVLILDTCGVETSLPNFPNGGLMDVLLSCQCAASNGDSDFDGVKNCLDACPLDSNTSVVGLCGCGAEDIDSDLDGTPDCLDLCPQDPTKALDAGVCGCNVAEIDSDSDGIPDCLDLCPLDPSKFRPGICPGNEWISITSKVTHQSSTDSSYSSHLAVDDSTAANFYQGSCTLTNVENSPWWYVDLGYTFHVEQVRLTPRTDCCASSLLGLEVWTSTIGALVCVCVW